MRNLLAAGMFRLTHSKLLYLGLGATVLLECYTMLSERDKLRLMDTPLEQSLFSYPIYLVLIIASFCGIYFGMEYSSGTLRNKVIAGISKKKIYLTNLLLAMGVSLLFSLAAVLAGLPLGLFLQGEFLREPAVLAQYFLCSLGVAVAIGSFSVMVTMVISNRAIGLLVCVMTVLALLFFGQFLTQALNEPEFTRPTERFVENGMVSYIVDSDAPEVPNPYYPKGVQRALYQFLFYFLPQGQCFQIAFLGLENPALCLGSAALFILLTTGAGMIAFQKKDIK